MDHEYVGTERQAQQMIKLPRELGALPNSALVPADAQIMIHKARVPDRRPGYEGPERAPCGTPVKPITLAMAVTYGTSVCRRAACYGTGGW